MRSPIFSPDRRRIADTPLKLHRHHDKVVLIAGYVAYQNRRIHIDDFKRNVFAFDDLENVGNVTLIETRRYSRPLVIRVDVIVHLAARLIVRRNFDPSIRKDEFDRVQIAIRENRRAIQNLQKRVAFDDRLVIETRRDDFRKVGKFPFDARRKIRRVPHANENFLPRGVDAEFDGAGIGDEFRKLVERLLRQDDPLFKARI